MMPIHQADPGDECDRCDQTTVRCVVCGRPPYFAAPAPLCSLDCLFAFRARFQLVATPEPR